MASLDSLQQILDTAKSEFERDLPLNTPLRDILAITSVDKVWAEVEKLQYEQERKSNLRHANRIKLFLDRLRSYAAVIEVFIQVKPDVLALLWGPIKLLLMWTAEWQQALDAIIRTIERIGDRLPSFGEVRKHFIDKERTKDVLGLFYRDILDFYLEVLTFFSRPRHKQMFDVLWPKRRDRITVVEASMERHAQLLEITSEHIIREHEARTKSTEEH